MKCENCGAPIRKRDNHCPKCGMEIFNSEHKPLQKKYLRGEYLTDDESSADYYLEDENHSDQSYQKEPYQNWDDYGQDPHEDYHQDDDVKMSNPENVHDHRYEPEDKSNPAEQNISSNSDFSGDTDHNKSYNSERSYGKKYKKNKSYNKYDQDRGYDNQHSKNKSYKGKHRQGDYPQKKSVRRGYDLDAYYGTEEKQSSLLTTAILFLVLALLIGFVMGFIFFSGKIQNLLP